LFVSMAFVSMAAWSTISRFDFCANVLGDTMDASRWERLKQLLDLALEKEPDQRSAFLHEACAGDESLRQEVESLLAAYQEAGVTVKGSIRIPSVFKSADVQHQAQHRRIGPYQVLQAVGSGGMATVYLATRADDEYRKLVAIKVIHPDIAHPELQRRFRNERQTLAALDHPNIVRLLDGGTTEDGMPYLVMDYVEGTTIDEYCDGHKLATDERLRLFLGVCSAVGYAHQRLVIHRDLKPGNILVTSDGTPKLLDFGIAKLLNPEAQATLVLTQTGVRPMTLAYASPEQVRGEPLTNATDVYSLGVVLYELLTGHRPHQIKGSTLGNIERAICEDEPAKPSTAITRVEERTGADGTMIPLTPEEVSRTRDGDPKKLRERLQGDLDAIVMTALRKEPQRRYASVFEFSEDIKRHLEHKPVKARPSTLAYRGAKFVRRHREMAAAALMFVLLLAVAITWYATTRGRSGAYRMAPVKGRHSIAVLGFKNLSGKPEEAWLSTALSEMLTTELTAGGKLRTIPGENVARMKLDLSLPDSDSLAQDTLKKVYQNLGSDLVVLGSYLNMGDTLRVDLQLQDAGRGETVAALSETGAESHLLDLVNRAGEQLRQKCGVAEVAKSEVAAVTNSMIATPATARLYSEALSKMRLFDFIGAREVLEQAVAAEPKQPLIHRALGEAWSKLGYEAKAAAEAKQAFELSGNLPRDEQKLIEGQYSEAARQWPKAVESYRDLFQSSPDNVDYGLSLARVQSASGAGKDALVTVDKLHQLPAPIGQDPRIDLAEAHAASTISDYKKAEAAAGVASSKAQSMGARFLMAEAKTEQGAALIDLNAYDKAVPILHEAEQVYQATGDELGRARVLMQLGTLSYNQGNLTEASDYSGQALAAARRIGNRKLIADALTDQASVWDDQGHHERAEGAYQQALAIQREIANVRGVAYVLANLAALLADRGDVKKATPLFEEEVTIARDTGNKRLLVNGLLNFGQMLKSEGKLAESRDKLNEALTLAQQIDDRRHAAILTYAIGEVLLAQGDLAGARKMEEAALAASTEIGEKGQIASYQVSLARVMLAENHFAEAETHSRQAAAEGQKEKEADLEGEANVALTDVLLAQNKLTEAEEVVRRTRQIAIQNPVIQIEAAIVDAKLSAAQGKTSAAGKSLGVLVSRSVKMGCVPCQFDARLALGQFEMKSGQTASGRAHLQALEREAQAQDFALIARQAAEAEAIPQPKGH
jgi:eukaryotic-like serine/threonine-protein kinase